MMSRLGRSARIHAAWLSFLASAVLVAFLSTLLAFDPARWFGPRVEARPLVVFCAAGLKGPVEAVAREYQEQYGVEVQLQYGGSNTLLASLEVTDRADVYIPADDSYVATARDKGLIAEVLPLARQKPVLAVKKGNPKKVRGLDDVISRRLKVAQANP